MAAFMGRLQELASAHDALTAENWNRVLLREIVARALNVFDNVGSGRFIVTGDSDVWIGADQSSRLAMVLHELLTNAIKYGALSNGAGRVAISWERRTAEQGPRLKLSWQESGGPSVVKPERAGFGTTLIERALQSEDSAIELHYDPRGVRAVFDVAL
jgi:two-component sensor histidine kinase